MSFFVFSVISFAAPHRYEIHSKSIEYRYPEIGTFAFSSTNNAKTPLFTGIFGLLIHFDPFVGTEELAHMEIVAAIIHQLTRDLDLEEIKASGFGPYYIDHAVGIWPQSAGGVPFNANQFQSKGDTITDLVEDMAAEQKARSTYENILRVVKDPDVCDVIRYLRSREIVHFQRFGETLARVQEKLDHRNFYAFNPSFDMTSK